MKPQPLDLEELKKDMYPEDIFPKITNNEWKKINKLLMKELGFPLDRVSANLNRKMWKNMSEWFVEQIKSAVQGLLAEIENRKEMLERTINYVTQKRKCSVKARIDELDTILWKIKKYFPDEVKENE